MAEPLLEQPDAADLLATARAVVLDELLPSLPDSRRFAARMVANAMTIAARAMAADPAPVGQRLAALDAGGGEAVLARLAAAIRAGQYDPGTPQHEAVAAALVALARLRCGVSAPKALERRP